jgi:phosphoribosylformylglycinamidine (FGAM) synthase PurS component
VSGVRVGRRIELTVDADDQTAAHGIVDRLAGDLLSNPLIEAYDIELLAEASSIVGAARNA